MANFEYIALDAKGEQKTGSIDAASDADAISKIRAKGLYPTQVVEQGKGALNAASSKGKAAPAGKTKGKAKAKSHN